MKPGQRGLEAELVAAATFTRCGYLVSRPLDDGALYDLIVDRDGMLLKAQVKRRQPKWQRSGVIVVKARSHRGVNYREFVDAVAVVDVETGEVWLVPVVDVDKDVVTLRVTPPRNGQHTGIRLAERYRLKAL